MRKRYIRVTTSSYNDGALPNDLNLPFDGVSDSENILGLDGIMAETIVNVKWFGAVGDGVTDDTTAIQAAITYAVTLGGSTTVYLPSGHYLVTSTLVVPGTVRIVGDGRNITFIVGSDTSSLDILISVSGSLSTSSTATVDVAKNVTTITVSNGGLFAAGDYIVLADGYSYAPTDSTYKSGEMLKVASVAGNVLTVEYGVRGSWANAAGSYTVANTATVYKVAFIKGFVLSDLSVQMRTDIANTCVFAQWLESPVITRVGIVQGGGIGFRIHGSWQPTVSDISVDYLTDNVGNGQVGYGVAVSGPTENMVGSNWTIYRVRHAFTTMGNSRGMPHNIRISNSVASGVTTAAWDTHAAGESITFNGCDAFGGNVGYTIRARKVTIQNPTVERMSGPGIQTAETLWADAFISGGSIRDAFRGVQTADIVASGLTITGLLTERTQYSGIYVHACISQVRIIGNVCLDYGAVGSAQAGIQAPSTSNTVADGSTWVVADNTLGVTGIGVASNPITVTGSSLANVAVINNRWFGTHGFGIGSTAARTMRNYKCDTDRPVVTGSRGGNAALASLLTALVNHGILTDSSSA